MSTGLSERLYTSKQHKLLRLLTPQHRQRHPSPPAPQLLQMPEKETQQASMVEQQAHEKEAQGAEENQEEGHRIRV